MKKKQQAPVFFTELEHVGSLVTTELESIFRSRVNEASAISPSYLSTVTTISDFLLRRGKAIRPFLTWCGGHIAGQKNTKELLKLAAAVEMNHYYLLSLDDVADRDEQRHGGPTIEMVYREYFSKIQDPAIRKHYGRSLSEITSALLQSFTMSQLNTLTLPAEEKQKLIDAFLKWCVRDPVVGWRLGFEQNIAPISEVDEDQFLLGLRFVSAHYTFVGPLVVGLRTVPGSEQLEAACIEYGSHAGLGFQLFDDILGVFGNPKKTGKPARNDVREGKKTLLIQYAYKKSDAKDRQFLDNVVGTEAALQEIGRVRKIITNTGALAMVQKRAYQEAELAIASLNTIPNSKYRTFLEELARYVVNRDR